MVGKEVKGDMGGREECTSLLVLDAGLFAGVCHEILNQRLLTVEDR